MLRRLPNKLNTRASSSSTKIFLPNLLFVVLKLIYMTNLWNTHPKNYGAGSRQWYDFKAAHPIFSTLFSRVCTNGHAIIRKYALNICRQCFRERASQIGFLKVCVTSSWHSSLPLDAVNIDRFSEYTSTESTFNMFSTVRWFRWRIYCLIFCDGGDSPQDLMKEPSLASFY